MDGLTQAIAEHGWKLLAAFVLGGAIGLERELSGKPAGLRTNMLIAMGSTLITSVSIEIAGDSADPGRIAAQIVTGVGFLGAGSIIQSRASVVGLTTAATIWTVAGIGIAIGAGSLALATFATGAILLCLTVLRPVEHWTVGRREHVQIRVVLANEVATSAVITLLSGTTVEVEQTTLRRTAKGFDLSVACVVKSGFVPALLGKLLGIDGVMSAVVSD